MKRKIKTLIKLILEYPIHFCVLHKKSLINNTSWIKRLLKRYLYTLKLASNFPFRIFAGRYVRYVNKMITNDSSVYQTLKENWIKAYQSFDERYKLLMSKVFYTFNIFDKEVCELLIKDSVSFENEEYKRWMFYDISRMSFMFPESIYPEYYNDRRTLLKGVASYNPLAAAVLPCINCFIIYPPSGIAVNCSTCHFE